MSKRAKNHPRFVLYRNPRNGTIVIGKWGAVRRYSNGQRAYIIPLVDLGPDGGAEPGNYQYDNNWPSCLQTEMSVADFLGEADQFADAVVRGLALSASPNPAA